MKKILGAVLFSTLAPAWAQPTVFPVGAWETRTPEAVGVQSASLKNALATLGKSIDVSHTVIVKDGYLIHQGKNAKKKVRLYSATKSFTSTVLGLLVDQNKIALDDYAFKYTSSLKASYSGVQLKHFATMTSGYDAKGESYAGGDGSKTPFTPAKPLFAPGTQYAYWDDAIHMYSMVLTQAAKASMSSVFKNGVADRIGMSGWSWASIGKTGSIVVNGGAGDMNASAYESAKFGHLFLAQGLWRGQQLISKNWVEAATTVQVPNTFKQSKYRTNYGAVGTYGYNWWVNGVKPNGQRKWPAAPAKTYAAVGAFSNLIIVVPEWNMVVVRLWNGTKKAAGDATINDFFAKLSQGLKP